MKLSLYNTILKLGERATIVYNALSDMFVAIRTPDLAFPQHAEDIEALKSSSPELYEQLTTIGAILDDNVDEVAILRQRIRDIDFDGSYFIMHVNPTLDCNFNCWYCYENHQKGSMISEDVASKILSNCSRIISGESGDISKFELSFFGGEPLLGFGRVKHLIERVSELCEKYNVSFRTGFTSNGFLLTDEMISFLSKFDCSFQITLDGGKEEHNNTRFGKGGIPSYDKILENVVKLAKAGIMITLRINYTAKNAESTKAIVDWLSTVPEDIRCKIEVDYQRVWQDKTTEGVDATYHLIKDLRREIRKLGYVTLNNRILHGVTNSCYGDRYNHVLVNYDGSLFGCTAREFNKENSFGNISENGFVWDKEKHEQWYSLKFSKKVCETCRIAPLCGGGCRRQAMDHQNEEECMYNYTPEIIDEFILERFEDRYLH